jgi:hypothetical protein
MGAGKEKAIMTTDEVTEDYRVITDREFEQIRERYRQQSDYDEGHVNDNDRLFGLPENMKFKWQVYHPFIRDAPRRFGMFNIIDWHFVRF